MWKACILAVLFVSAWATQDQSDELHSLSQEVEQAEKEAIIGLSFVESAQSLLASDMQEQLQNAQDEESLEEELAASAEDESAEEGGESEEEEAEEAEAEALEEEIETAVAEGAEEVEEEEEAEEEEEEEDNLALLQVGEEETEEEVQGEDNEAIFLSLQQEIALAEKQVAEDMLREEGFDPDQQEEQEEEEEEEGGETQEENSEEEKEESESDEAETAFVEGFGAVGDNWSPGSAGPYQYGMQMTMDPARYGYNPYLTGVNPHYDGYTPTHHPNAWAPSFAPWVVPPQYVAGGGVQASYHSVYSPAYANPLVMPRVAGSYSNLYSSHPGWNNGHAAPDPHAYGPHLDFPFGAWHHDYARLPAIGAGTNSPAAFPQ